MAVSTDNDWKDFSKDITEIDVIDDLTKAIDILNKQHNIRLSKNILTKIKNTLLKNSQNILKDQIISSASTNLFINTINANSDYEYTLIDTSLEVNEAELLIDIENKNNSDIRLIANDSNSVTFNIDCMIFCTATATYSLRTWDSIDKEYVYIGSSEKSVEKIHKASINITMPLEKNKLNEMRSHIEIVNPSVDVDMDYIEPFENHGHQYR